MTAPLPEVSVVIPTRDRWPLLEVAVRSVLAQRDVELEVIVVDDGSTDNTPSRLQALGDARVRVVPHKRSEGVARARNDGIAAARGPWVAFLDDDDAWAPFKLRHQLDALATSGGFSYTGLVRIGDDFRIIDAPPPPSADGLRVALRKQNVIDAPSSVVVAAGLLRDLRGFDEHFSILADWELYLRLVAVTNPAVVEQPLVAYRVHAGNMHSTRAGELLTEVDDLSRKHVDLSVDRARFWEYTARAMRRSGMIGPASRLMLRLAFQTRSPAHFARALIYPFGDAAARRATGVRVATSRADVATPEWVETLIEQWKSAGVQPS